MSFDKRISELQPATNLNLEDVLPLVNNGVTRKVSLRELINELQINIPQPRIKIAKASEKYSGHEMIFASWEGSDSSFLKFQPEFWLYRYKKADFRTTPTKESTERRKSERKKRFVHPSHHHGEAHMIANGKGSSLYAGAQIISIKGQKGEIAPRNTEWPVGQYPLQEIHLDLDPWKYYRLPKMDPFVGLDPILSTEEQPVPRGVNDARARLVVFKVRIAINNPDDKSPVTKLFGPFSETFICYPAKTEKIFDRFRYFLGAESSPALLRSNLPKDA
jgi:hypothetical protein